LLEFNGAMKASQPAMHSDEVIAETMTGKKKRGNVTNIMLNKKIKILLRSK